MKNLADLAEIEKEIEKLREKLNKEVDNIDRTKTTPEEILKISREVDEWIVKYQRDLNKV